MRTAFVLQPSPCVGALHEERHVAVAAVIGGLARQHLGLEAAALGVVLVHPVEVAGPEIPLLAALGALDLDDHVAALVRVAGQEQFLDPGFELGAARLLLGDLGPDVLPHLVVGVAGEELARVGEVTIRSRPTRATRRRPA